MDPASSLSHAANVAADPAAAPTADKRSVLYDLIDFFLEGGIQIWGLITGKRIREADVPWLPARRTRMLRRNTGIQRSFVSRAARRWRWSAQARPQG